MNYSGLIFEPESTKCFVGISFSMKNKYPFVAGPWGAAGARRRGLRKGEEGVPPARRKPKAPPKKGFPEAPSGGRILVGAHYCPGGRLAGFAEPPLFRRAPR
jgi:hypothetical protein